MPNILWFQSCKSDDSLLLSVYIIVNLMDFGLLVRKSEDVTWEIVVSFILAIHRLNDEGRLGNF